MAAANSNNSSKELLAPIILMLSTIIGFVWSNSQVADSYFALFNTKLSFAIGEMTLINKSLLLLINDGLMAVFFLFIGLELKREVVVGELSNVRKAMVSIFAAVGGMLVPALFYIIFNFNSAASSGWGIPMATDIAFALGILAILGSKVPTTLKVMLTAVAIVDDLGAILVIALFYTSNIDMTSLLLALAFFAGCIGLNKIGVVKLSIYLLMGLPMWYFMLKSGVHATIAGVLLAMTIPLCRRDRDANKTIKDIFEDKASALDSPAVFLEKSLYKWVGLLIIPIFALANSGVELGSVAFGTVSLGIVLGLVVGKPVGIVGASWLAQKLGVGELPPQVNFRRLTGLGFLAGIGFTMSLFIGSLAFTDSALQSEAKLAIIMSSVIAGTIGSFLLLRQK